MPGQNTSQNVSIAIKIVINSYQLKWNASYSGYFCLKNISNISSLSCPPPGFGVQPFSPFWFTVEPQDTLANRGSPALLNCTVHSDAAVPARIEWKKDGTFMSLVSDERRQVLPDGSLLFLHVVHSRHNKPDEGIYQCVATIDNLGSISSRTARLSVAGKSRVLSAQFLTNN